MFRPVKIAKIDRKSYSPIEKVFNMRWDFHKYDRDGFPSVPHGHSFDGKYKISLWDGSIYDRTTGKKVGNAKKKDLNKWQKNKIFMEFYYGAREWYMSEYPDRKIIPKETPRLICNMEHTIGHKLNSISIVLNCRISEKGYYYGRT